MTLTLQINRKENFPKIWEYLSLNTCRDPTAAEMDTAVSPDRVSNYTWRSSLTYYLNFQTCGHDWSGSNALPDIQKFKETLQKLKVWFCFWRISSVLSSLWLQAVFSFVACCSDITVRMTVTEHRLFNLKSKLLENTHTSVKRTHNIEITLKAGAAGHNLRSNSTQEDAVKSWSTQRRYFNRRKLLIQMDVALMISKPIRASLKMLQQISKQMFDKNINEHLILGGNALLDTVTVIILLKFIRNVLYYSVTV